MKSNSRMSLQVQILSVSVALAIGGLGTSCGPKAYTKGEYDDPTKVRLLDDKFNEADLQQMADSIVSSMVQCPEISGAKRPPTVIMERVQNRTEEHIDMKSLSDKVRTALSQTRKIKFVNKEERETLEEEYQHSDAGYVSPETRKKRGKQIGADFIMSGALTSNIQQVGDDKLVYYKITMNLTNLETSVIDCTEEKEIRKKYRKQTY